MQPKDLLQLARNHKIISLLGLTFLIVGLYFATGIVKRLQHRKSMEQKEIQMVDKLAKIGKDRILVLIVSKNRTLQTCHQIIELYRRSLFWRNIDVGVVFYNNIVGGVDFIKMLEKECYKQTGSDDFIHDIRSQIYIEDRPSHLFVDPFFSLAETFKHFHRNHKYVLSLKQNSCFVQHWDERYLDEMQKLGLLEISTANSNKSAVVLTDVHPSKNKLLMYTVANDSNKGFYQRFTKFNKQGAPIFATEIKKRNVRPIRAFLFNSACWFTTPETTLLLLDQICRWISYNSNQYNSYELDMYCTLRLIEKSIEFYIPQQSSVFIVNDVRDNNEDTSISNIKWVPKFFGTETLNRYILRNGIDLTQSKITNSDTIVGLVGGQPREMIEEIHGSFYRANKLIRLFLYEHQS